MAARLLLRRSLRLELRRREAVLPVELKGNRTEGGVETWGRLRQPTDQVRRGLEHPVEPAVGVQSGLEGCLQGTGRLGTDHDLVVVQHLVVEDGKQQTSGDTTPNANGMGLQFAARTTAMRACGYGRPWLVAPIGGRAYRHAPGTGWADLAPLDG